MRATLPPCSPGRRCEITDDDEIRLIFQPLRTHCLAIEHDHKLVLINRAGSVWKNLDRGNIGKFVYFDGHLYLNIDMVHFRRTPAVSWKQKDRLGTFVSRWYSDHYCQLKQKPPALHHLKEHNNQLST